MAKIDLDRRIDRQIVLDDLKKRMIDLTENNPQLPPVAWDANPVRYFKLNEQWCKILAGWLDHMESEAFWPDAEGQDYAGIQGILAFEVGIELPEGGELDCDAVEVCLMQSEYINSLINLIENMQVVIDGLQEKIDELEDEAPIDGVDLPPNPSMGSGADNLCRSAHYVADWIYSELLATWDKAKTLTVDEFLDAILGTIWFNFENALGFWQFAQTISSPTLAADAGDYKENIAMAFFCAELDLEAAIVAINDDLEIPALEKSLWIAIIDNFRQSQIDEKALIGTLTDTEPDCTGGCPWVVVWDFDSTYVPLGDEDAIYAGNTWVVAGGNYFPDQGYVGNNDVWTISKDLPEQCKVGNWVHRVNKNNLCLAVDIAVTWRGISGTDPEGFSPEGRVLNNEPYSQFWGGIAAVLSQMTIRHDHFFCGGDHYGSETHWVRMTGTGAMPQN